MQPFSLKDKTVLVVGASSGIGRAIAIASSKMGAQLVLSSRNVDLLNETKSFLEPDVSHEVMPVDLSKQEEIDLLVDQLPLLDGIVLSAGINKRCPIAFTKQNDLEDILTANFIGSVWLLKRILSKRKLAKGASIVIISSIAVTNSSVGDAIYSASKGALNSFSKVLALEVASKKIRVNTIRPGMVNTKLKESGPLTDEDYKKDMSNYPLKRYGEPDDISLCSCFLIV